MKKHLSTLNPKTNSPIKSPEFSHNTLSAQGQLVREWFKHLNPDLDQPVQQLQALVQCTVEHRLQLLRQRHWALGRRTGQPNKANGFYPRCLDTTFGSIHGLRVPRLRHGSLPPLGFTRSQRRWKKGDRLSLQGFLDGLSCRKTASILDRHLGWGLSASLVSRLAGHLHQALEGSVRRRG